MNGLWNFALLLIALLPLLFIGGLILLFVRIYQKGQNRIKSFQNTAREMNFTFHGEVPYANLHGAANSELFTSGDDAGSRHIYNLMTGAINNFNVSIFDFVYYISSRDFDDQTHSQQYFQTVVMLDFAQSDVPQFLLKPESGRIMQAVNNALGNRRGEVKFPAHPVFNEKYLLRGADEQRIRALFNNRALSFYESHAGLSTEGGPNRLIFYRNRVKVEPDKIRHALDEALTAANSFLNPNFAGH